MSEGQSKDTRTKKYPTSKTSSSADHSERDTDYTDLQALKETTEVALKGLLEVKRNKDVLHQLRAVKNRRIERESKL